jgi:uncharacterized protein YbbC (DUF1343 family)
MLTRLIFCLFVTFPLIASVKVGADRLFEEEYLAVLKGKRIGLITNQSAMNSDLQTTFEILEEGQKRGFTLACVFAPEHGFYGDAYAYETIKDRKLGDIPLYGLFGERRRPTAEMLQALDVLIYDVQDIGSRSYTFISTLFYCMEEAARAHIPMIVLDRPNPMGGIVVDGPLVEESWRSFLGYVAVPYCHGMTVGELARYFNAEYRVGCDLTVVAMREWKRGMCFSETGLSWVPTSPQIPESDTSFFYPTTGLIGHCSLVNIGIGYTLPFKLIGAPWLDAQQLAEQLNRQKLPGVFFQVYYYRPFFGKFKLENCQGVRIVITDPNTFLPVTTQFTIMGIIKNLYPKNFHDALVQVQANANARDVFNKLNGSEEVLNIIAQEKFIIWKLRDLCQVARTAFAPIRSKYLDPSYN